MVNMNIIEKIKDGKYWIVEKVECDDYKVRLRKRLKMPCSKVGIAIAKLHFSKEVFARRVSELFGFDIVPEIEQFNDPCGVFGVIQQYVYGKEYGDAVAPLAALQRIALFDIVTNNYDRAAGNWLIGSDRKAWALDNGDILRRIPCMAPTARFLFRTWEKEISEFALHIVGREDRYIEFIEHEYFNHSIVRSVWRRKMMFDAVHSQFGTIRSMLKGE
jgi:hypothetical protein